MQFVDLMLVYIINYVWTFHCKTCIKTCSQSFYNVNNGFAQKGNRDGWYVNLGGMLKFKACYLHNLVMQWFSC